MNFEIANKRRLGKLDESYGVVVENYESFARQLGVESLCLTAAHTLLAGSMGWGHRDPFDCIITAQAALENLVLITNDAQTANHPWISSVWQHSTGAARGRRGDGAGAARNACPPMLATCS
ncbi:MAG: type II toxin-antitoxin system VapC family toxin [Actinomycetia bacterium]|nr:type II toxin-antitoxin system VapC family toxin [Actinomycetes bacterium]